MALQQGRRQMRNDFPVAEMEFHNEDSHLEARRPHHMLPNMPPPSEVPRQGAWVDPNKDWDDHDVDVDDDTVLVGRPLTSHSGPSSESTASDDTIVNHRVASTSQPQPLLDAGLTMDKMALHDKVQPLGTMSTYEWIHGRRCPGDSDAKDISSKNSMKVGPCRSRVSQSTGGPEDDFAVVNHPSSAFVTGAGDWAADVAAPPVSLDEFLS